MGGSLGGTKIGWAIGAWELRTRIQGRKRQKCWSDLDWNGCIDERIFDA